MCGNYTEVLYSPSEVLGKESAGQVEALEFEEDATLVLSRRHEQYSFVLTASEGADYENLTYILWRSGKALGVSQLATHFYCISSILCSNCSQVDMRPQDLWQLYRHVSVANSGLVVPHLSLSIMLSKP